MPHEMIKFTKKVSSILLKNTTGFIKKITMYDSVCFFFFFFVVVFLFFIIIIIICNRSRQLVPI